MIKIWEVVNYESVRKMLNLLYSQKPHSFSPLFHPNSASNHPKITLFSPHFSLRSAQNHPISLQNHPQFSIHFTLIPPQFSLTLSCVSLSSPMRTIKDEHAGEEGRKLTIEVKADI